MLVFSVYELYIITFKRLEKRTTWILVYVDGSLSKREAKASRLGEVGKIVQAESRKVSGTRRQVCTTRRALTTLTSVRFQVP